jgi:Arc/MetJ-type ribon-helix-helix transcriptional regulator
MTIKTVSVGPVRIPKEYKDGLDQLKAGKPHISYSDLLREAIYLLLIKKGVINEEKPIT